MTDQPIDRPKQPSAPRRRRLKWLLLGGPLLAVCGLFLGRAWAHGPGPFRACMHPDASEEEVEACIDDGVDMLLARLDATDAQRTQVKAIARRTVPELRKLHAGRKGMKESMMTALGRDPINPAEVEKLRQEAVAAMTRGSELLSRAAVETAQVLTPEQRKKVATFMKRHRGRGPGFGSF